MFSEHYTQHIKDATHRCLVLKVEDFTMSCIYIRNGKGPTTDPWGKSHVTFKKEDILTVILVH